MAEATTRTVVCSVMFLDIVGYSKGTDAEQQKLKQTFNEVLTRALEGVPPRDVIVLDTGDGAAIAFIGNPEDALAVAIGVRGNVASLPPGSLPARMGINLGPVKLVWDINGQLNILGDGINVAQRVMNFAQPGQLLASRSYYEMVSRLSNDYAGLFSLVGTRTDKHVREHEVYAVAEGTGFASRASESRQAQAARRQGADTTLQLFASELAQAPEPVPEVPAKVFDAGANHRVRIQQIERPGDLGEARPGRVSGGVRGQPGRRQMGRLVHAPEGPRRRLQGRESRIYARGDRPDARSGR